MADAPDLLHLSNGVRVALDPMPGLETAALGVWIEVGARQEPASINGVAHLFEHMAFKGAGPRDARQLAEAFEEAGGTANAATGYERTAYVARTLAEHAGAGLDLICDMLLEPHWRPEELEKEKGVVLQEISEALDVPEDRTFELHQATVFADQALGRPILGSAETLAGISVETLHAFRAEHMRPETVVVSVAGNFSRQEILDCAERRLGSIRSGSVENLAPARPCGGARIEGRRTAQAHLVVSWQGPALGTGSMLSARVLCEILGGGMASRLFQQVREQLGLAYAIDAFIDSYADAGRLCVYAGCAPRDVGQVLSLSQAALEALATEGPTERELARARAVAGAQLLMGAESAAARAEARAGQVLTHGRLIGLREIKGEIDEVSAAQVQARAAEALQGPAALALTGPRSRLPRHLPNFPPA